jgi:hypothetical protein
MNPILTRVLFEKLAEGVPISSAAPFAGIDKTTYHDWIEKSFLPGAPKAYRDFRDSANAAIAKGEIALLDRLAKVSEGKGKPEVRVQKTYDGKGNLTGRTETITQPAEDGKLVAQRLRYLNPETYGNNNILQQSVQIANSNAVNTPVTIQYQIVDPSEDEKSIDPNT